MLFLDLAKAYDSVEFWALDDAMRGMGIPDKVLDLMFTLDTNAKAKVLMGADQQTQWIPLGRGAAQGEVMSPLRFIAWMNLLLEVIEEYRKENGEKLGYKMSYGMRYSGQAFCDDGWFIEESKESLQVICELISAFMELYKVKINANKSYYMVTGKNTENGPGFLQLWDHTANEMKGEWKEVREAEPTTPVRYLGIMISADMDGSTQTKKVIALVNKHLTRIEAAKCSMDLANYLLKAVIGGILNYHAPFTKLTQEELKRMDARIRKILTP